MNKGKEMTTENCYVTTMIMVSKQIRRDGDGTL